VQDTLERSVASFITRQFVLLDENISIANAVNQMHSKKVETIIVESKDKKEFGVVTDSDILDKVVIKGIDSDEIFLKDIMTYPVITLTPKSTVHEALELMKVKKIKRIPIINQENPYEMLGIVTQTVLANAIRTSVLEQTFRPYRVLVREHYKPIAGNLGFLMQFAGILMIAPALIATFLGENKSATGIYLAVVSTSITGFILNVYGEKSPLNLKQSSIVVVLGFVLLSIFGSFPYMYVNPFWSGIDITTLFVNSFFESSSGFTTTGISTITHPEDLPVSFSFYRSYTLWVGGLSFVYLVMSLYYPEKKLAAMRNILGAGILKFRQLVSTISIIFVFYAIILILLIYFLGNNNGGVLGTFTNSNNFVHMQTVTIIDSISIIFATLTSGGFVPVSTFLTLENVGQLLVVMAGMIIAALPFAFHYGIFSRKIKARELGSEIIVYVIFISLSILIFTSIEYQYLYSIISNNKSALAEDLSSNTEKGPELVWIISAFHVISASTTTGFQFIDMSNLSAQGKIELIIIMLIGGTAFSTAGGIKIARIILIFKLLNKKKYSSLKDILRFTSTSISSTPSQFTNYNKNNDGQKKLEHKQQKSKSEENKSSNSLYAASSSNSLKPPPVTITNKPLREAFLVVFLFVIISIVSAIAIGYLDNRSFIDTLFESSSALSNTGLSVGVATMNLDNISKSILSFNMILGRFEIIAVLYIFIDRLRK